MSSFCEAVVEIPVPVSFGRIKMVAGTRRRHWFTIKVKAMSGNPHPIWLLLFGSLCVFGFVRQLLRGRVFWGYPITRTYRSDDYPTMFWSSEMMLVSWALWNIWFYIMGTSRVWMVGLVTLVVVPAIVLPVCKRLDEKRHGRK